jgi:hypothetical protein
MRVQIVNNVNTTLLATVQPASGSATSGGHAVSANCGTTTYNPCSPAPPSLSCGVATSYSMGSTAGAWNSYGGPFGVPGQEKLFQFTPAVTGTYAVGVTVSSGYNDLFWKPVSSGCNATGWTYVDDIITSATNNVNLTAGVAYYFLLDDEDQTGNTGSITITCPSTTYNPCTSIPVISGCGVTATASMSGTGAGWSVTSCGYSTPGQERLFQFTAPTTGTYQLNVSAITGGFIDFFWKPASSGCNATGWNCIDDIISTGTYAAVTPMNFTAGVTYYILLDPEGSGSYTSSFSLVCPTPVYNPCTSIPVISNCGVTATASMSGTGAGWSVTSCGYSTPGQEQLFQFTAPTTGTYQLNVSAITGGFIDFFWKPASSGCNATGWNCIDDIISTGTYAAVTPMNFTAGVTYYILLDPEATGAYTSSFSLVCPVVAPPNPTAVTASSSSICVGNSVTLTAGGPSGTVYWFTTGCNTTGQIATGNSITVSPTATTTYYARNYNNSTWSAGCATTTVTVNPLPTISASPSTSICSGNTAQLSATVSSSTTATATFNYTGSMQTFTVPAGVTSISVDARGAQGGAGGGLGGRVTCNYAVTPGDVLDIYVGGQGGAQVSNSPGGYNGGGNAGPCNVQYPGSGGGGASDIRLNGTALTNRIIVAGGGGGSHPINNNPGAGGGLTGGNVTSTGNGCISTYATGGTQSVGGLSATATSACCSFVATAPAALGVGANGAGPSPNCNNGDGGAGGGGGYYGGGSGGTYSAGGGGSSYTGSGATAVVHTQGFNSGNGSLTITYSSPSAVVWSPSSTLSSSTILNPVASPTSTTTYTVTTTVNGCSNSSTTTVTVNTPPVSPTAASQTICYGANAQLVASANADWYTQPVGGTLLGTATSFTTPALLATTTYYIEGASNGCPPTSRNPVTVNVNAAPTTISAATALSTGCNIFSPSSWSYFVEPNNSIVTSVWSSNNLNAVSADVSVLPSVPYQNGVPYMPRVVAISPGSQGAATVRLYFTWAEFQMLQAAEPQLTNITQLGVTKFDNPNLTGNPMFLSPSAYLTPAQTNIPNVYAVEVLTPSFSTFTIHFNHGNTILPVEFTSQTAVCGNSGVSVQWSTASESQCSHYEVFRSFDGFSYEKIGSVAGAGTTSMPNDYLLFDAINWSGPIYYRIDQFDYNGDVKRSPLIVADCKGRKLRAQIVPNPANSTSTLVYDASKSGLANLYILDSRGNLIKQSSHYFEEGANTVNLSWDLIESGLYTIRVEFDGEQQNLKQSIIH